MKKTVQQEVWQRAQTGHLETWVGWAQVREGESAERSAGWRALLEAVDAAAPIKPGESVLDIGCGLNTVLDFISDVRGYTLDPLAARLTQLGLAPGVSHVAGVFESLPFASQSFDRVFLMNVLDHVQAPAGGIEEIARVTRPGGVLVLSVDTFSGRRYLEKRFHKWWGRIRGARTKHPWVFSIPAVEQLLRQFGFEPGTAVHAPGAKPRRTLFVARRLG